MIVAFGAERGESGLERKRAMLTDKNVDLVVYNDVSRSDIGFDAKDNEVRPDHARGGEAHRQGAEVADRGRGARRGGRAAAMSTEPRPVDAATSARTVERIVDERRARRPRRRRDAAARRPLPRQRGPPDHRGLPGRRKDDAREGARALGRLHVLADPVHARPAADGHHRASTSSTSARTSSTSGTARSSRTSCSSTRSTAPRRRRSRRCSSACRRRR